MDAVDQRDLDAAVEVNMRAWVDGPYRSAGQVDPDVRTRIATMQRDGFLNTREFATRWREEPLVTALEHRLGEIHTEALVLWASSTCSSSATRRRCSPTGSGGRGCTSFATRLTPPRSSGLAPSARLWFRS
jgi:hypothetical protein